MRDLDAPPSTLGPASFQPAGGAPADGDDSFDSYDEQVAEARSAVAVGIWISALRCVLLYVVAPAAGAVGVVLGPTAMVLQLLGAVTSAAGAWRLYGLGQRVWPAYAAVAALVGLLAVHSVLIVAGVLR